MRKLIFPFIAAAAVSLLACAPAEARTSQTIADWSKVEQDGGGFVTCPAAIRSADRSFPHACLVGVRTKADPNRMVNVLGFYNAYGIPRSNPDPRIEPLPRLYNLTPWVPPANAVAQSKLKAGDSFPVMCAGKPLTATFSRIETSTNRFTAFVPNIIGDANIGRRLIRFEMDGKPVGRDSCQLAE